MPSFTLHFATSVTFFVTVYVPATACVFPSYFADVACRIAKVLGVSVEFLIEKSELDINESMAGETGAFPHDYEPAATITKMLSEKERLFYKYESILSDLDKIPATQQKPLLNYIHAISGQG